VPVHDILSVAAGRRRTALSASPVMINRTGEGA